MTESIYIDKPVHLSSLVHEQELAFRETEGHLETEFGSEAEWLRYLNEEFPKFVPFLADKCGLRFHFNRIVNALTHARYLFIANKRLDRT